MSISGWNDDDDKGWFVISTILSIVLVGAGLLYWSAEAKAADTFIALSVGLVNDNPPVATVGGMSVGPDENQARIQSLTDCQNKGGNHCVTQVIVANSCAAAASNDFGEMMGISDPNITTAQNNAVSLLSNQQGAHVVISGCTNPIRDIPEGIDQAPVVEQAPDSPAPPPPPCQPQPWCQWTGQIPQLPVTVG